MSNNDLNKLAGIKPTMEKFVAVMRKHNPQFTEDEIRKAVDRCSFWTSLPSTEEAWIMHQYKNHLADRFGFDIDTNVDGRLK